MTKLDAKKELDSLPKDFAVLDKPCDSHSMEKTRKGKRYDEVGHDD